jgi:hypothetical protein
VRSGDEVLNTGETFNPSSDQLFSPRVLDLGLASFLALKQSTIRATSNTASRVPITIPAIAPAVRPLFLEAVSSCSAALAMSLEELTVSVASAEDADEVAKAVIAVVVFSSEAEFAEKEEEVLDAWGIVVTSIVSVVIRTAESSVTVDKMIWGSMGAVSTMTLPLAVVVMMEGPAPSVIAVTNSDRVIVSSKVGTVKVTTESEAANETVLKTARKGSRGCLRSIAAAWNERNLGRSKERLKLDREGSDVPGTYHSKSWNAGVCL